MFVNYCLEVSTHFLCFEITLNCLPLYRLAFLIHVPFMFLNKTNFKNEKNQRTESWRDWLFAIAHSKPQQAPHSNGVKENILGNAFSLGSRRPHQACMVRSLIGFLPLGKQTNKQTNLHDELILPSNQRLPHLQLFLVYKWNYSLESAPVSTFTLESVIKKSPFRLGVTREFFPNFLTAINQHTQRTARCKCLEVPIHITPSFQLLRLSRLSLRACIFFFFMLQV